MSNLELTNINNLDSFRAGLVNSATFVGKYELPSVPSSNTIPKTLITFDKAISKRSYDSWVHFYTYDYRFERFWNRPQKYLEILQRYAGVISPDFSLYRDMPLSIQIYNTYRNRALGYWLSANGIDVIPNVRWGDERSFSFCFDGIDIGKTVAVGTHGCIKKAEDSRYFRLGLDAMIQKISPIRIIVYGKAPQKIFGKYEKSIDIIHFDSEFSQIHQREAI